MSTETFAMAKQMLPQLEVKPPLLLSALERDRLSSLAETSLAREPSDDAWLLLEEVMRADTLPAERMPPRVVAMNSYVEYRDERNGTVRRVQLVYPHRARISEGRISVLSLVGAALIGLAEGDSICCWTRDRGERRFSVLRVSAKPFAAKDRPDVGQAIPKSRRKRRAAAAHGAA